jgi:hypothetical protein
LGHGRVAPGWVTFDLFSPLLALRAPRCDSVI